MGVTQVCHVVEGWCHYE